MAVENVVAVREDGHFVSWPGVRTANCSAGERRSRQSSCLVQLGLATEPGRSHEQQSNTGDRQSTQWHFAIQWRSCHRQSLYEDPTGRRRDCEVSCRTSTGDRHGATLRRPGLIDRFAHAHKEAPARSVKRIHVKHAPKERAATKTVTSSKTRTPVKPEAAKPGAGKRNKAT